MISWHPSIGCQARKLLDGGGEGPTLGGSITDLWVKSWFTRFSTCCRLVSYVEKNSAIVRYLGKPLVASMIVSCHCCTTLMSSYQCSSHLVPK